MKKIIHSVVAAILVMIQVSFGLVLILNNHLYFGFFNYFFGACLVYLICLKWFGVIKIEVVEK